jgi:hypothetical protein
VVGGRLREQGAETRACFLELKSALAVKARGVSG